MNHKAPEIGETVHYHDRDNVNETGWPEACRAALVIRRYPENKKSDYPDTVGLMVFCLPNDPHGTREFNVGMRYEAMAYKLTELTAEWTTGKWHFIHDCPFKKSKENA
jgi:hypothetical protein